MAKSIEELLRGFWEERGNKNISLSKRPERDIDNEGNLLPVEVRISNIKERLMDLSILLEDFNKLYIEKYNLYGDLLLAFIGDDLVRDWPWKDFPFTSKAAKKVFEKHEIKFDIVGLMDADIGNIATKLKSNLKEANREIRYEHWTPIAFFRDIFVIAQERGITLNKDIFYNLLVINYRTVRITKEEDSRLNKAGYRSNRPISAYEELGIDIEEEAIWVSFLRS